MWALHNVKEDDPIIMRYLLATTEGVNLHRFKFELEQERDKAQRNSDQGKLAFIDSLGII